MLAQSVISSFRLTTQGALVSHGVFRVLYTHMCRAGCSSRLRHLALLQDLAADEPSCFTFRRPSGGAELSTEGGCVDGTDLGLPAALLIIIAFDCESERVRVS